MVIKAVNFGEVLISRPAGREAFMAAQAYVFPKDGIADNQVTLDFEGVKVLAPSWADEFITGIKNNYTKKISYLNTANPSVAQTLKTLEEGEEQGRK